MKRLTQIMPLLRNLFINPATGNTIAFILRWGVGTAVGVGAYDACSGATGYSMTSTNRIYGTNGMYMSNNIVLVISGSNKASASDYEFLSTTSGTLVSSLLYNGQSTTNGCLPPGLIFKCNLPTTTSTIGGYLYGTPTNAASGAISNITLTVWANGNGNAQPTNIVINILAAAAGIAPAITNQPASLTNNVGSNATFSVTAGGTAPLSYQWYFNTNTTLPNATNTSLALTNIQLTNTGNYRVIITNSTGSVTSSFAALTVWLPPVITNQPAGLTNRVGSNVTFSVTAGGWPAPGYQWKFNTNTAVLNATNATLSLTGIQLTNTGNYSVVISNAAGTLTSSYAPLTVWQPPVITNQPAGVTNLAGGSASFTVVAGGVPTVSYQWVYNAASPVAGATAATYGIANLRASQAGNYTVIITNNAGAVTSTPAILAVTTPAAPKLSPAAIVSGKFQFTFNPVAGLTNTVLTNNVLGSGTWTALTNIPPPANTNAVTVADSLSASNRFYRVQIIP